MTSWTTSSPKTGAERRPKPKTSSEVRGKRAKTPVNARRCKHGGSLTFGLGRGLKLGTRVPYASFHQAP